MRGTLLLLVAVASAAVVACGDDGGGAARDLQAYCALVADLDARGEAAFSTVPPTASDEQLSAVESEFYASIDADMNRAIEIAPEEIASDVAAYVDATRARVAGGEYDEAAASAAEERLLAWEDTNCPGPSPQP